MTISRACAAVLMLALPAGVAAGSTRVEARVRLAQGSVTIPSDAQLNRLEREAITTPPLDVSEPPPGAEPGTQERHRDRRDRRIDRRLPERGGACDGC
ncbi:hypothetical protein [Methylobacterium sp. CM6257]